MSGVRRFLVAVEFPADGIDGIDLTIDEVEERLDVSIVAPDHKIKALGLGRAGILNGKVVALADTSEGLDLFVEAAAIGLEGLGDWNVEPRAVEEGEVVVERFLDALRPGSFVDHEGARWEWRAYEGGLAALVPFDEDSVVFVDEGTDQTPENLARAVASFHGEYCRECRGTTPDTAAVLRGDRRVDDVELP